jgi:hypothetical protein
MVCNDSPIIWQEERRRRMNEKDKEGREEGGEVLEMREKGEKGRVENGE